MGDQETSALVLLLEVDDVRDLLGRAFGSLAVVDLDADDLALLERLRLAFDAQGAGGLFDA